LAATAHASVKHGHVDTLETIMRSIRSLTVAARWVGIGEIAPR